MKPTAEEFLRNHPVLLGETEDGEDYLSTDDIELIKQLAPILEEYAATREVKMPGDEDIEKWVKSHGYYGLCTTEYYEGLTEGIDWLRKQIEK